MATKKSMVTAVFRHRTDWQNAYEWLQDRGYSNAEINVLMSENTRSAYMATEQREGTIHASTHAAEGIGVGGAVGTAVGATLGAVLAIGTSLAIPGLGLIIAGPLAAAFAAGGAGAVAGGIVGGLIGLGIPEPNAKAYLEALREGGVVIGVVPHSSDDLDTIKEYFRDHRGESICYC